MIHPNVGPARDPAEATLLEFHQDHANCGVDLKRTEAGDLFFEADALHTFLFTLYIARRAIGIAELNRTVTH